MLNMANLIVKLTCKIKGRKYVSKFIDSLFFGSNNRNFKPCRTDYDWLSRNEKEVDKYINDEMCGSYVYVWISEDFTGTQIYRR